MAAVIEETVTGAGTSTSSVDLASWTPSADDLIIVIATIRHDDESISSVSGNNASFSQEFRHISARGQINQDVWVARPASPTTGQITVTLTGAPNSVSIQAVRLSGAGSIEVTAQGDHGGTLLEDDNASPEVTIGVLSDDSLVLVASSDRPESYSVGSGFTANELNTLAGSAGESTMTSTSYQVVNSGSLLCDGTYTAATDWIQSALAITAASPNEGSGAIEAKGSLEGEGETTLEGSGEVESTGTLSGTGDASLTVTEGSGDVTAEATLSGEGHNELLPPSAGGGSGAIYGIDFYGTEYYGVPKFLDFDASPFVAEPYGYSTLRITWGTPSGEWDWLRIVRNSYGAPDFESDGMVIAEIFGHSSNEIFDRDLREGNFYYYSIFFHSTETGSWHRAGAAIGLVSKDFGYSEKMFSWIPGWFQERDNDLGHTRHGVGDGPLRRFLGVVGLGADFIRTELETLRWTRRPERISGDLLPILAHQYGIPIEPAIGMRRTRFWLRDAVFLYHRKGTLPGIQGVVTTITGWDCNVNYGPNILRGIDADAWFIDGGTIADDLDLSRFERGDVVTEITGSNWTISNVPISEEDVRYHGIQIEDEEPYTLSAEFWTEAGTADVGAEIEWYNELGNSLLVETLANPVEVDSNGVTAVVHAGFSPTDAAYVAVRFTGTASVFMQRAQFVQGGGGGDWSPPMMLDIEVLPIRTNFVTNPSFEFGVMTWSIDEGEIVRTETNAVAGDAVLEVTEAGDVPILDGGDAATVQADSLDGGSATNEPEDFLDGGSAVGIHANLGGASIVTGGPYEIDTPLIQHALSVRTTDSTTRARVRWVDGDQNTLLTTDWSESQEVFRSPWREITLSTFPPADAVAAMVDIQVSVGTTIDAVMLEAADVAGDYFDGATFGGDYIWSGQPHVSASRFYPQRAVRSSRLRDLLPDYLPVNQTFNVRFVAELDEAIGLEVGPDTLGVGTLGTMDMGQ